MYYDIAALWLTVPYFHQFILLNQEMHERIEDGGPTFFGRVIDVFFQNIYRSLIKCAWEGEMLACYDEAQISSFSYPLPEAFTTFSFLKLQFLCL